KISAANHERVAATRNVFALTLPDRLLAANDILTIGFAPDSNNAPASELFFNRANLEFLLSFPLAAPRAFIRSPKRGRLATLTRKPALRLRRSKGNRRAKRKEADSHLANS